MKLITELNEAVEVLTEETDKKKNLYIKGIFLMSEIVNKNGRLYPSSVMEKEVNRYDKEFIKESKAWGELNHPDSPQINPVNISHRICEITRDGNNWIGKAIITDTPMGNIVRGLLESGGKIGVSSRALGSLVKNSSGINVVQEDFKLSTAADIVLDPSAPSAFVNGIMEGVEFIAGPNGSYAPMIVDTKEKIEEVYTHRLSKEEKEQKFQMIFEQFLAANQKRK